MSSLCNATAITQVEHFNWVHNPHRAVETTHRGLELQGAAGIARNDHVGLGTVNMTNFPSHKSV